MEIKRDAYLQQLIERKDNGMIKVITGIRRCGKSLSLIHIQMCIRDRYETEQAIEAICESYRRTLAMETVDPLILIPTFISDFLCICLLYTSQTDENG